MCRDIFFPENFLKIEYNEKPFALVQTIPFTSSNSELSREGNSPSSTVNTIGFQP